MGVFRFKQFDVVNERSAMKVNTDGVLLGAAMTIMPEDRRFLDIGTGTGTIALMAAQRVREIPCQAGDDNVISEPAVRIDAIDVDEASAEEAGMNFRNSPWAGGLYAHNLPLDQFAAQTDGKYDLIFSNPPYFEDSLTAPDERKSTARHTTDGLSYRDILDFAKERLTEQEAALCRYARMCGLHLFNILRVRTVTRKQPTRIIAEFSRARCESPKDAILTIQNEGQYTQEYLSLTHEFYLFA